MPDPRPARRGLRPPALRTGQQRHRDGWIWAVRRELAIARMPRQYATADALAAVIDWRLTPPAGRIELDSEGRFAGISAGVLAEVQQVLTRTGLIGPSDVPDEFLAMDDGTRAEAA